MPCTGSWTEARTGPLYLRIPEIANLVVEAVHYRAGSLRHYSLHSWVIMPNHVHLLVTPLVAVSKLTHSLKRFTAREANRILNLTGSPFWQEESYDHSSGIALSFSGLRDTLNRIRSKPDWSTARKSSPGPAQRPIPNRPQVLNLPHKNST